MIRKWHALAEMFDLDIRHIADERDVLFKTRPSKPQVGMTRRERMANLKNTFSVKNASKIAGKRILLIDDVYTTGATTNECAGMLVKNGAERVDALTFGRTM